MRTSFVLTVLSLLPASPGFCQDEAPRLVVQTGHGGAKAAAFSPDGKRVVTGRAGQLSVSGK